MTIACCDRTEWFADANVRNLRHEFCEDHYGGVCGAYAMQVLLDRAHIRYHTTKGGSE